MSALNRPRVVSHQITMQEAVAEAGGRFALLALEDEEHVFLALWSAQDRMLERMRGVEVEKVPYEEIEKYIELLFAK